MSSALQPTPIMSDFLTVTMNPALDIATSTERLVPESKLRCAPEKRDPGGGGVNVARVIRRLGGDVIAAFPSGGIVGEWLQRLLVAEGIQILPEAIEGRTRQGFTVVERSTEKEYRFVMPGPEMSEAEWRRCLSTFTTFKTAPAYVISSGSLSPGVPPEFHGCIAREAGKKGARAVVDTAGKALALALDEGLYLVKMNLNEMRELTGASLEDTAGQLDSARRLIQEGKAEVVCLTLGRDGAMIVSEDEGWFAEAPQVKPVSTVGAGDSFLGALLWATHEGRPMVEAFRLGVAAGSAALLTPGTDLARSEDIWRLFETVRPRPLTRRGREVARADARLG